MKKILLLLCFVFISTPIYLVALPLAIIGFIAKCSIELAIDHAADFIDWITE